MTHCPNCGKDQGHLHIGQKFPLSSNISCCRVDCECGVSAIIFQIKNMESPQLDELCKIVDEYMEVTGSAPGCVANC